MMGFQFYTPLADFSWPGNKFELAEGILISDDVVLPDLGETKKHLSEIEWKRVRAPRHWLTIEFQEGGPSSPSAIANLVVLALWIVNPSPTRFEFNFVVSDDGRYQKTGRNMARFHYIEGKLFDDFSDAKLQRATHIFATLRDLYERDTRLRASILTTITGCWSGEWSTALICYAAAVEGLLTYERAPGITRRLATTFACLSKVTQQDRDTAYRHFYNLYNVRSSIMHGRVHDIHEQERLTRLDEWQNALRSLWEIVSDRAPLQAALEGTDDDRRNYLLPLQVGFVAPRIP